MAPSHKSWLALPALSVGPRVQDTSCRDEQLRAQTNKSGRKQHACRANEPSWVPENIARGGHRPRIRTRFDRARGSCDAQAEMLIVAAGRSQIRQRPGLLRHTGEETE